MEAMLLLHDIDNIAQSLALMNVKIFYNLTVLAPLVDWESWSTRIDRRLADIKWKESMLEVAFHCHSSSRIPAFQMYLERERKMLQAVFHDDETAALIVAGLWGEAIGWLTGLSLADELGDLGKDLILVFTFQAVVICSGCHCRPHESGDLSCPQLLVACCTSAHGEW